MRPEDRDAIAAMVELAQQYRDWGKLEEARGVERAIVSFRESVRAVEREGDPS